MPGVVSAAVFTPWRASACRGLPAAAASVRGLNIICGRYDANICPKIATYICSVSRWKVLVTLWKLNLAKTASFLLFHSVVTKRSSR